MKILFICKEGINRSVTAKVMYSGIHETKSLGILDKSGLKVNPSLEYLLEWSDVVVTMEDWQKETIENYYDIKKPIFSLEIPDLFIKNEIKLKNLIKEKMDPILQELQRN